MSIYDKSSLVLIPSGTKTGKVFSQKPVSGDGDFTFTRASAATRVNADGNIEKETQNLLLQSNSFDTTWGTSNTSIASGQSGYDGSSDAWLLTSTAGGGAIGQSISSSGVQTFSVYAKVGTLNWMAMTISGLSPSQAYFDLANGALGSSGSEIITSNIESVGGGWYRCSVLVNGAVSGVNIYPANANNQVGILGSINIQDAQLNQGLIAQEVITTTTTALYGGITDNTPRLDYTDSSCPALLLEPQRTNKCPNSELYGTSFINTSVTRNAVSAPSGYIEAGRLLDNNSLGEHLLGHNFSSFASGETHSISCFFKADATGGRAVIRYYGGSWVYAVYNLDSGEVEVENGGITADIVPYANGWYRCILTHTTTLNYAPMVTQIGIANSNNQFFYQGASNLGLYFYGYQAETGSYATSYIPTYGSSVSRVADACNDAGTAATFNSTEGVLYTEISALINDGTNRAICIYKDSSLDNIIVIQYNNISQNIRYLYRQGVTSIADLNFIVSDITSVHKIAGSWANNNFRLFVDGVKVGEQLSGNVAPANTFITLGFNRPDGQLFEGKAKQVLYFPTALSDSELATLTTI